MYNSPIRIITSDLGMKVTEDLNEQIYQSVLNVGIDVDKGELLRALRFDRGQYAKGYADGKAAQEWISVKDRLPEAHRLVLCRWTRGIGASYGLARYQHENDVWYVTNEGMPEVTHWMPLPEPPKGE